MKLSNLSERLYQCEGYSPNVLQAEHFESRAIPAEKKASQLDSHAKSLADKAAGAEGNLAELQDSHQQSEATVAEYQEELQTAVSRANRLAAALRTEHEKLATAEKEAEELRKKTTEDAGHARVLAERVAALEKMISSTEESSMVTKNKLDEDVKKADSVAKSEAEKRSVMETNANELQNEKGGLLSSLGGLKSKMLGAFSKVEEKESQANAKAEESEEAQGKAAELESSVAVKSEKLDDAQEKNEELESKLKSVALKANQADSATEELEQNKTKLGEMNEGLQSSGQRLADLGGKLSSLRKERDQAVASAGTSESRYEFYRVLSIIVV